MEPCLDAGASETDYRNSDEESASRIVTLQGGHTSCDDLHTPQTATTEKTATDHHADLQIHYYYDSLADTNNVGNEIIVDNHHVEVEEETDMVGKLDPTTSSDEGTSYSPASSDHPSASTSQELSSDDNLDPAYCENKNSCSSAIDNHAVQRNRASRRVDRFVLCGKRRRNRLRRDKEMNGPKRRKMFDCRDNDAVHRIRNEEFEDVDHSFNAPGDESSSNDIANNALLHNDDEEFEEVGFNALGGGSSASESDRGFDESFDDGVEEDVLYESSSSDGYNTQSSQSSLETSFESCDSDLSADEGDVSASESEGDSFGSCFGFRNTTSSLVKRDTNGDHEPLLSPKHFLTQGA